MSRTSRNPSTAGQYRHFTESLYSAVEDTPGLKTRLSRSVASGLNLMLDSLLNSQKIIVTKQVLRNLIKNQKREVRFTILNSDENLDAEDPFQSEGFALNVKNPNILEFNLQDWNDPILKDESSRDRGKLSEGLEQTFNDKVFTVLTREGQITKRVGSIRLVNGNYHAFDMNEDYMFQIEKVTSAVKGQVNMQVVKRKDEGEVLAELANMEIGPWNSLTLEGEIGFVQGCTPREKMMILGAILALMMKMPAKEKGVGNQTVRQSCSMGSMWRDFYGKMRSLFA